jgi:protein HIRA/HIR1
MCYVWNVTTLSSPHPPISLAPVLDAAVHSFTDKPLAGPSITNARLSSTGRIVVTLSNGDGYSYNPSMYTWQRICEPWWAVSSQYWNTAGTSVGNLQSSSNRSDSASTEVPVSAGIIPFLERNTTQEVLTRGRGYFLQRLIKVLLSREGFESFESGASIAHLENRVAAALSLGAKEEFRSYLSTYAKRLGAEGLKMKAEELLASLMGGIFEDSQTTDEQAEKDQQNSKIAEGNQSTWENGTDTLCGWPRRDLLKDVLLALGSSIP